MSSIEIILAKFGLLIAVCLFILIFCLCSFYNDSERSIRNSVGIRREVVENYISTREQHRYITSTLSYYLNERNTMNIELSEIEKDESVDEIIDSDDVIIIVGPCGKKKLGTRIVK